MKKTLRSRQSADQGAPTGTLGCLMATANSSASSFCRSISAAFLSCAHTSDSCQESRVR